jgi:hypothetical protein
LPSLKAKSTYKWLEDNLSASLPNHRIKHDFGQVQNSLGQDSRQNASSTGACCISLKKDVVKETKDDFSKRAVNTAHPVNNNFWMPTQIGVPF